MWGLAGLVDREGFLYSYPTGPLPTGDGWYWLHIQDRLHDAWSVNFVLSVIDDIALHFNVDPRRVYLVGHSNGGFMAYRMACDHPDRIAAVATHGSFVTSWDCAPSQAVHVLHMHGTLDQAVNYTAGATLQGARVTGAPATAATWRV